MPIMHLLFPGACPEMPTGPPMDTGDPQETEYIARHGALPPHWGEGRREEFECARDDAVMLIHRPRATRQQRDSARLWLRRHNLDHRGRPVRYPGAPQEGELTLAR